MKRISRFDLCTFCAILSFSQAYSLPANLTCVLKYRNWIDRDGLVIRWTVPDSISTRQDLNVIVTWMKEFSGGVDYGACDETTVTSCKMNYGSMIFTYEFFLNVSVADKRNQTLFQQQWFINPDDCRLPPPLTAVVADVINSTCIDISWYYDAECSDFDDKLYRILVIHEKKILYPNGFDLVTLCNGSYLVCDLHPFTSYTFMVQCKLGDWNLTPRGHFSNSSTISARTKQDVPSEAPAMVDGGYSYIENMCDAENTRQLEIFWKDIPDNSKNGIIETFQLNITASDQKTTQNVPVAGHTFSVILVLRCDTSYVITNRAVTIVGPSANYTHMTVPEYAEDVDIIDEVIPIYVDGSFHVFWTLKDSGTDLNNTRFVLFWCVKIRTHTCVDDVDWITVPASLPEITLSLQKDLAPHQYQIGLATTHTGIHWASCYYLTSQDLEPPSGLAVEEDMSLPGGSLIVKWVNWPCENRAPGPFVRYFLLSYCKVKDVGSKKCTGDILQVKVGKDKRSFIFSDLVPYAVYKLSISTVGWDTQGNRSQSVWGTASMSGPSVGRRWIAIGVVAVLFFATLILISYRVARKCARFYTKCARISVPENPDNVSEQGLL